MKYLGNYRLAAQQGCAGYFAEVSVAVATDEGQAGLQVEFAAGLEMSWHSGALFGVAYAFERSPLVQVRSKRVTVQVTDLRGHLVDTTEVLVAYAAAQAFWQAVGTRPPREPIFDPATAAIIFPR